ncbi:MAG: gamma carbonic anhydrase family protein [Gammaproteobacteria bacterium]|nr:gamma carbonic anhydrase family protein [Gammaproteobacteria bacterium]
MLYSLENRRPELAADCYVAPSADLIGSVRLGARASVWFGAVLRGDREWILVGDGSNVQDGTVIHADPGDPVDIGADVTIGHRVLLHGCRVGSYSLIGNGAIVLDRVRIGEHCLIGAGALIPPDKTIPDHSVVLGAPGRIVRTVTEEDMARIAQAAANYRQRILRYAHLVPAVANVR